MMSEAVAECWSVRLHPDLYGDAVREFISWAYGLFGETPQDGDVDRKVYATPYEGHYGPAGWILTINGSPTRVTILVSPLNDMMIAIFGDGTIRKGQAVSGQQCQMVRYEECIDWLKRFDLSYRG